MTGNKVRQQFLDYFEKQKHKILPSSSLVPDDPSLLLATAGMVQFKPIFLGEEKSDYTRVSTCQKCVRTTDIDEVGRTSRHLTFFEMLGNFSFGDYYKKEAIAWAWEFLTKDLGINSEKLWITIFKDDKEAFDIWQKDVGIKNDRIVKMREDDNFWSMGPVGPCGPCSEIIYDLGEEHGCGETDCSVGCDCDRYLEVWNLVFMQYNRDEEGKLHPLGKKGIDTGMGLERVVSILQGVTNNYETDLIKPLIDKICELAKIKYPKDERKDTSVKIIADHTRAVTFLIADGVLPSNEGKGYVLRRLLRRAVRHGRLIGIKKTFLPELSTSLVNMMKGTYPELNENYEFIMSILRSEEERFGETLRSGLNILNEVVTEAQKGKSTQIKGEVVFQLYDTYGFPLELTEEIAQESGLLLDRKGFDRLMEEQRKKAKESWQEGKMAGSREIYTEVSDKSGKVEFVGYSSDKTEAKILAIIGADAKKSKAKSGEEVEIILNKTPFYAEMGGQVADKGEITTSTGKVEITNVQSPFTDWYVHRGKVTSGHIEADQTTEAVIDSKRRKAICKNHTATHLLHWALRLVLGEHVKQSGSLVAPDRLRFDFSHYSALSDTEIEKTERLVNGKIFESQPVRCYNTSFDFAKDSGAIALFGEKYSDFVRVMEVGNFSKELCGGTHVTNTSEIGMVKIVSEESVGANLRRIEAVSGDAALDYTYKEEEDLKQIASLLKVSKDKAPLKIKQLIGELKEKRQEITRIKSELFISRVDEFLSCAKKVEGVSVLVAQVKADNQEDLRNYSDVIKARLKSAIVVLGAGEKNKAMLVASATPDIVKKGFNCGRLIKEIAPIVDGGGGGKANLAQAGGKDAAQLKRALERALTFIKKEIKEVKNESKTKK